MRDLYENEKLEIQTIMDRRLREYVDRHGKPPAWVIVTREAREIWRAAILQFYYRIVIPHHLHEPPPVPDPAETLEVMSVKIRTMGPWAMIFPDTRDAMIHSPGVCTYEDRTRKPREGMPAASWGRMKDRRRWKRNAKRDRRDRARLEGMK